MKRIVIAFLICMLAPILLSTQSLAANPPDSVVIKQTVLDFYNGYYSGDTARMEKSIHPDINRATPRDVPQTGRTLLAYSTYSALIENTRAKVGALDDTARHIQVKIINIDTDVANVKVTSAAFTDFVQVVKLDGPWKIVNAISAAGIAGPPRFKEFNSESERPAIEKAAIDYLKGQSGGDAKRLELTISPDFSKITLIPFPATGHTGIRRQRYESLIENAIGGLGKQDEIYRDYRATVLDSHDGMAVVRCDQLGTYEFVQMYKSSGRWLILNSIIKANLNLTIAKAMTITAGDTMPNFTLPIYGGGTFTLADYRGKTVLLMFPRGWIGNAWCTYCPYQYLEFEQLQQSSDIEAKYNVKIAFVMPYSGDRIKDWLAKFPANLQTLETIKNPQPAPVAGTYQADYAAWANKKFPLKFNVKETDPHKIIPVLIDEDRALSRQLKIATGFWDNIPSEQNMASVFIIDKAGVLRLKYIGQMTEDRPSVDYILDFIKNMK
jgi:hypothetical protein